VPQSAFLDTPFEYAAPHAPLQPSTNNLQRYFQELRRTPRTNKGRLEAAQAAATAAPTGSATVASQRQAPKNATITAKKTASLGGSTLNTTHVPKGLEKIDPRLWFEGL